jgi:hypothetical protein
MNEKENKIDIMVETFHLRFYSLLSKSWGGVFVLSSTWKRPLHLLHASPSENSF